MRGREEVLLGEMVGMGGQGMDFANHLKWFIQMEAGRLLRVPRRMLVRSPGKQPGLAVDSFCSHYRGGVGMRTRWELKIWDITRSQAPA